MRSTLPGIALKLDADARTLRRAVARGTVRCRRPSPRRLEFASGELAYLCDHWTTLSTLSEAFRTEPTVSLAVLYGSRARGSDHAGSDVDLLVGFRDGARASASALARRMEARVGAAVDVAALSRVRAEAPLLLLQAVDEGRVLVDRDGVWENLQHSRETIARAARRQMARGRREAAESLAALLEGS
jgi:predicted nucleotidyltransferase